MNDVTHLGHVAYQMGDTSFFIAINHLRGQLTIPILYSGS